MLSARRIEELQQELKLHEKNLDLYQASRDHRVASTQRRIEEIHTALKLATTEQRIDEVHAEIGLAPAPQSPPLPVS